MDQILPNCTHLPPPTYWMDNCGHFVKLPFHGLLLTTYLPTSSCPCSYWMPPLRFMYNMQREIQLFYSIFRSHESKEKDLGFNTYWIHVSIRRHLMELGFQVRNRLVKTENYLILKWTRSKALKIQHSLQFKRSTGSTRSEYPYSQSQCNG